MQHATNRIASLLIGAAAAGLVVAAGCDKDTSTALGAAEVCDNGADDDGDDLTDCDDPDCVGHFACADRREFQCDNGADDDGDDLTDCDDPDCAQDPFCHPDRELSCADGIDNDGDGLVDCGDPDCQDSLDCKERCTDGIDNDGDNLTDCVDPDCAGAPACAGRHEQLCNDGDDNDGDGLTDCDDPDCAAAETCSPPVLEICDNYTTDGHPVDDDGDGAANCGDSDCMGGPACVEWICTNGGDDDHDGFVDCEDADCGSDPDCIPDPTCDRAEPIGCGETVVGTTRGRPNGISYYPDCGIAGELGGERVYELTLSSPGTDGEVQISLVPLDANVSLDLFVIGESSGGCDPGHFCQPATTVGSNGGRQMHIYPSGMGGRVYIVVDSVAARGGAFALWVDCGQNQGEPCASRCWDPNCSSDPNCQYWISGGTPCTGDDNCPGQEYCRPVYLQNGTPLQQGVCTQDCTSNLDCFNPVYAGGVCASDPNNPGDGFCVQTCGFGGPYQTGDCPENTVCATLSGFPTPTSGLCLPL